MAAHALPGLREREGEANIALQRVVVARETLDGEERRAKGRLAELERRIQEMSADLARDGAALEDAASMLARLASEEDDLGAGESTEAAEAALREQLVTAEDQRAEAEATLAKAQTGRAEADARRRALDERLRDESGRLSRHERDLAQAIASRAVLGHSLGLGDGSMPRSSACAP